MNVELKNKIWERDKGVCQSCGRKLFVEALETVEKELSNLKEIPIFKWSKKCWKCKEETPIVTYDFAVGYTYIIGDVEKLDKILMQKYPFIKKTFSRTMDCEVIANTCVNCGSLQGNWYVKEDLIEMVYERDMNELIDTVLPNTLTIKDLLIEQETLKSFKSAIKLSIGHIHHKDGNPENNTPDNLILLCNDCHNEIHSVPE